MPEDKDAATGANTGSNDTARLPIFESFVYEFVNPGLGGDPGGRPGTIGGPIGGQEPKYRVLTYQFTPSPTPNIDQLMLPTESWREKQSITSYGVHLFLVKSKATVEIRCGGQ